MCKHIHFVLQDVVPAQNVLNINELTANELGDFLVNDDPISEDTDLKTAIQKVGILSTLLKNPKVSKDKDNLKDLNIQVKKLIAKFSETMFNF